MRFRRSVLALAAALTLGASLTACTPTVSVPPGPSANAAECADFMVSIRNVKVLGGFDRVWTDSQATVAWGSPSSIIMSCGVEEVAASTFPCETVGGIDWIIDNSDPTFYRLTTFGREPAVQVFINLENLRDQQLTDAATSDSDANAVVTRLAKYVANFPTTGKTCTPRPTS